jgi:hypothetical protein
VTTRCTHCGKPLPREDARFCNNCGSFVGTQTNEDGGVVQNGQSAGRGQAEQGKRPALREQVAFPPPQKYSSSSKPPSWMERLERELQVAPTPRQLHTKVWIEPPSLADEDTHVESSVVLETDDRIAGEDLEARESRESGVEDLPTSRLVVPTTSNAARPEVEGVKDDEDARDAVEVEQLETRPMQTPRLGQAQLSSQPQGFSSSQGVSYPQQGPVQQPSYENGYKNQRQYQLEASQPDGARPFMPAGPVTPAIPVSQPGLSPLPPAPAAASMPASTLEKAQPKRRGRPLRLLVVAGALVLLLIAGFVVWVVKFQPFTVPGITNTSIAYQSGSLGFALSYPQGWTAREDAQHNTASFFDTNHTDQFNLALASTNGQTIEQYSKKLIAQLGMTGQKNLPPLTFAGTTWQVAQGTVLQTGVTYTETLLLAIHGEHFYSLLQIAPASTYADAERLFFAPVRASFRFL